MLARNCLFSLNKWLIVRSARRHEVYRTLCSTSNQNLQENSDKQDAGFSSLRTYSSEDVESQLYDWWEAQGYFKPNKSSKTFTMILPPPNVTGTLHLGHAFTVTIQDVLVRWRRMKGESVLWIPGFDHAGIATQVIVEKHIKKKLNLTRHDVGREEFIKHVWNWKGNVQDIIIGQLRKLGASLDWSEQIFTLDADHSHLVIEAFIKLYEDGVIYRADSLVNWSCTLQSSISDIEVEWLEINGPTKILVPGYKEPVEFGVLTSLAYKICDADEEIVVSTTRPETMPGDTAVAVHPNDSRYTKFHGKFAWHPFRKCKIPIVLDESVQPEFGTGALKVTPAHDLTDFQIAERHALEKVPVIDERGKMVEVRGIEGIHGMKRFSARKYLLDQLKDLGLLRGYQNHSMKIPICSRSGDVIEHLSKPHWFVRIENLAKKSMQTVESGQVTIKPDHYQKILFHWLGNDVDWNLSRQVWWGHRVPMYECSAGGQAVWVAAPDPNQAKAKAAKQLNASAAEITAKQDPDVLDTWFSSGLLPLSSVERSTEKKDSKERYPLSLMETGQDIIFFWVAKMMMLGIQLTGQVPFREVLLHGMICDAHGKKMSKSSGNVILPEDVIHGATLEKLNDSLRDAQSKGLLSEAEVLKGIAGNEKAFGNGIEKCGTDALRLTLCSLDLQNRDINFDVVEANANRKFCNKIWNVIKFIRLYCEKETQPLTSVLDLQEMNLFDRGILDKLAKAVTNVESALSEHQLHIAVWEMKEFFFSQYCCVYIEATKPILNSENLRRRMCTLSVLFNCAEVFLRLMSPFMPYLTEYLYRELPPCEGFSKSESIMIARYPDPKEWQQWRNQEVNLQYEKVIRLKQTLQRMRTQYLVPARKSIAVIPNGLQEVSLPEVKDIIVFTAGVLDVTSDEKVLRGKITVKEPVDEDCVAFLVLNLSKEEIMKRWTPILQREDKTKKSLELLLSTTSKEDYKETSKPEKIKEHEKKIKTLQELLNKIKEMRNAVENMA